MDSDEKVTIHLDAKVWEWDDVIKHLREHGIPYGWTESGDIQILKKWCFEEQMCPEHGIFYDVVCPLCGWKKE